MFQIDPVNQDFKVTTENLNGRFVSLVIETLRYRSVKMCETLMERRTKISAKIERIEKLVDFNNFFYKIERIWTITNSVIIEYIEKWVNFSNFSYKIKRIS